MYSRSRYHWAQSDTLVSYNRRMGSGLAPALLSDIHRDVFMGFQLASLGWARSRMLLSSSASLTDFHHVQSHSVTKVSSSHTVSGQFTRAPVIQSKKKNHKSNHDFSDGSGG